MMHQAPGTLNCARAQAGGGVVAPSTTLRNPRQFSLCVRRQQLQQQHQARCQLQQLQHTCATPASARRRRHVPVNAAPSSDWSLDFDKNPQNTENPKVLPSPSLSPEQAVTVQLEAISHNDTPWENHGVQTMYEFAEDCGSMERSRYFGFSKDLYHLDHFLGGFKTACAPLVDCSAFTLLQDPPSEPLLKPLEPAHPAGMAAVYVAVTDSAGGDGGVWELRLVQRELGLKKGCWMTKSCLRVK